ncbi:MAG: DNA (cytosine-5-)-methyltransferase [Verrucomicrobia bacterium]|jgi:DNA (cytosine-5)-methyltransferase 1|nr:DNA (cytosine-5-)-methyltransferase [Verrucomicrobiota bacterium]
MRSELTAGAVFSGIGGFCLGLERQGISTLWAIENDESAVLSYNHNLKRTDSLMAEQPLRDIKAVGVKANNLPPVDILHAGFPCQSFSQAGARRGFDDPRGKLFFELMRLVNEFGENKPSVLLFENTPFLRHGAGGQWFLEVQKQIQKAGYWFSDSSCAELDLFDHTELPQQRNRLFMVAFLIDRFKNGRFSFPEKSHANKVKTLESYIDFSGNKQPQYYLPKDNRYCKMIEAHVDGQPRIYQLRKYLVRKKDVGVCPTLTANMGQGGHNVPFICDGQGLRKLTEEECLALQGFPESFEFPTDIPPHKQYVHIGNSVSPLLAEKLGRQIRIKIEEERL